MKKNQKEKNLVCRKVGDASLEDDQKGKRDKMEHARCEGVLKGGVLEPDPMASLWECSYCYACQRV